jgi:hypothetical protein
VGVFDAVLGMRMRQKIDLHNPSRGFSSTPFESNQKPFRWQAGIKGPVNDANLIK